VTTGAGLRIIHLHHPGMMELLQNPRPHLPVAQRVVHRPCPVLLRQILADFHTTGSPGQFGEPADLQDQLALALAELLQFLPTLDLQPRVNPRRGQRPRIHQPSPRNHFLQRHEMFFTQLPNPKVGQRTQPKKREPQLFLDPRLGRGRHGTPAFRHFAQKFH